MEGALKTEALLSGKGSRSEGVSRNQRQPPLKPGRSPAAPAQVTDSHVVEAALGLFPTGALFSSPLK